MHIFIVREICLCYRFPALKSVNTILNNIDVDIGDIESIRTREIQSSVVQNNP